MSVMVHPEGDVAVIHGRRNRVDGRFRIDPVNSAVRVTWFPRLRRPVEGISRFGTGSAGGVFRFERRFLYAWGMKRPLNPVPTRILPALFLMLPCGIAHAGDTILFEIISEGLANGVSDDGSAVVGQNNSGGFIWTLDGLQEIGGVAAIAADADGSFITGDRSLPSGDSAARYVATGGWTQFGGLGPSGCDSSLSSAYDISSNGQRCVGLGWDGCAASAFLWSPDGGMFELPRIGSSATRADTISGDGTVIGGWDQASNGSRRAAAWFENAKTGEWEETLVLESTFGNSAGYGEVNGSNGDGSILVGSADGTTDSTSGAFMYLADDGVQMLGLLPPNDFPYGGGALDVAEDGRTVVGYQREGFGGGQSFRATYWTPETGLVDLKEHLNGLGAGIPAGFTLAAAQSISDDGTVICGWGYEGLFFFQDAWVVVLPGGKPVPCRSDLNDDGRVDGGDLGLLLAAWGTNDPAADLNEDGDVNGADLGLLLASWGVCP